MFSSVSLESSGRIRQATLQLADIKKMEAKPGDAFNELIKIQKGLLFVSLYAALEYTITASASQFLTCLQGDPKKPLDYKKYILCTALNSEFNAITSGTKRRLWQKKAQLIDSLFSDQVANFDNAVFPTDGKNISHDRIVEVWKIFHLPEPVIPEEIHPWLLQEIKRHRNAIAHGEEKAATIGGRFTIALLEVRLHAVTLLCAHIIDSFDRHYRAQSFLNETV